jgi:hypothetical protein
MKPNILPEEKTVLLEENEFSKHFNHRGDIDLYIAKAVDSETNKHYIVSTIREIKELNAHGIQFPFEFKTEKQRDKEFKNYGLKEAKMFIDYTIRFIKEKDEWKRKEQEKINSQAEQESNQENNQN